MPTQSRENDKHCAVPRDVVGETGKVLWVLMGTVAIVLLIARANVANLLLMRADGRQHELGIRAALGAGITASIRTSRSRALIRRATAQDTTGRFRTRE